MTMQQQQLFDLIEKKTSPPKTCLMFRKKDKFPFVIHFETNKPYANTMSIRTSIRFVRIKEDGSVRYCISYADKRKPIRNATTEQFLSVEKNETMILA